MVGLRADHPDFERVSWWNSWVVGSSPTMESWWGEGDKSKPNRPGPTMECGGLTAIRDGGGDRRTWKKCGRGLVSIQSQMAGEI
jgi:hypothetical protein